MWIVLFFAVAVSMWQAEDVIHASGKQERRMLGAAICAALWTWFLYLKAH